MGRRFAARASGPLVCAAAMLPPIAKRYRPALRACGASRDDREDDGARSKGVAKLVCVWNLRGTRREPCWQTVFEAPSGEPRVSATALQAVGGKGHGGFVLALVNA